MTRDTIRLGSGAGYSGDRIEPALELVERGEIDYLVFECLAERTIALAQQARRRDPDAGFDPLLGSRMRAVLGPALQRGVRIVTNMGAAHPVAAAQRTASIARELGLAPLRVAAVTGDDVLAQSWRATTASRRAARRCASSGIASSRPMPISASRRSALHCEPAPKSSSRAAPPIRPSSSHHWCMSSAGR